MKKLAKPIVCVSLALSLMFSLAACGEKNTDETTAPVKVDRSEEAIELVEEFLSEEYFDKKAEYCVDPDEFWDQLEESSNLDELGGDIDDINTGDDYIELVVDALVSEGWAEEVAEFYAELFIDASITEDSEYSVKKDDDQYIVTVKLKQRDSDDVNECLMQAINDTEQYSQENGISTWSEYNKIFKNFAEEGLEDIKMKSDKNKYVVVEQDGELKIDIEESDLGD